MEISEIADIASVTIALIGVILVLRQITLARISIDKDHLRRKKESIFNGYNLIREDIRKLNNKILENLDLTIDDKLTSEHLSKIRESTELRNKVQTLLSYIQRIAVGVENDIYDINILLDLSGTPFINTFDRYYPYILESRQASITYNQEAEYFINELRKLREKRIQEIRNVKI